MRQIFFWKAVYKDNTELKENGKSSFYDIRLKDLKEFRLEGPFNITIDLETGSFYKDGNKLVFKEFEEYFDLPIKYKLGLIQYKEAHRDFNSSFEPRGLPVIDTYNIGWKIKYSGVKYQVICTVLYSKIIFTFLRTDLENCIRRIDGTVVL